MSNLMTGTRSVRRGKGAMPPRMSMNIYGDMVAAPHKPATKPVDWAAPVVTWSNGQSANSHSHSDRLWEANIDKYQEVSMKLFGDHSQLWWDSRTPAQIEMFLREYWDNPEIVLCEIQKMYNRSNGGPVWGFSYRK